MDRWWDGEASSGAGQRLWSPVKALNFPSDDDGDGSHRRDEPMQKRKRKRKFLVVDEDDEEEVDEEERKFEEERGRAESRDSGSEVSEELEAEEPRPIGDVVRVSGSGEEQVNHYRAYEYAGCRYELEDPVLISPEVETKKPYVVIIKDITENIGNGQLLLIGQCFYRPEEARKKGGGTWQEIDSRELFYSFRQDSFNAESVMHKCVMNFVPLHKQLPNRRQFPGFIIQKVYDTEREELLNLTDTDNEEIAGLKIGLLVNETMKRIGDLPDLNIEDTAPLEKELCSCKLSSPIAKSMKDEGESKYNNILIKFHALTREKQRDYWLVKLLQSIEYACMQQEKEAKRHRDSCHLSVKKVKFQIIWPDTAVDAITALEKAINKAFSTDYKKYKNKMRQLEFNLKKCVPLAERLLKGELKPSEILNMSAEELKEGLTAEEIARNKPEDPIRMQMTDAKCRICSVQNVAVANIIKAGSTYKYELECLGCGRREYVSQERAATMTIYDPCTIKSPENKK